MNLTTKELSAISEQLGQEQMLIAKFDRLATATKDPELKAKFTEIGNSHQGHYTTLMSYLQ